MKITTRERRRKEKMQIRKTANKKMDQEDYKPTVKSVLKGPLVFLLFVSLFSLMAHTIEYIVPVIPHKYIAILQITAILWQLAAMANLVLANIFCD